MNGLDDFGSDDPNYVGFDYTALLKGAGGLLSGVAEGFGDGKKGGGVPPEVAMRLEQDRLKAEKSASTMKMVLIGFAGLVGVVGLVFLLKGRSAPAAGK
jgi:hypothetical protein